MNYIIIITVLLATVVIAIVLNEIFEYFFYRRFNCARDIYFVARLENDCPGTESLIRTLEKYAEKLTTSGNTPQIVLITERDDTETLRKINILKKDYINIRAVSQENCQDIFIE